MRFLYLRDPLFLPCFAAYWLNRFGLKKLSDGGFFHEHFNDLLCIPFWVPIMLTAQRAVGLRATDEKPAASEVIIPLLLWSWVFEILLPQTQWLGEWCWADHVDIVYYAAGALAAALFWRWWYGAGSVTPVQSA